MEKKEYVQLVNEAKRRSFEYYVLSKPTISDTEFDVLVSLIENVEKLHPEWTLPDSPTQCVGSDLSGNGRRLVKHRTPMLSCQKAQTLEAVEKWLAVTEKKMSTWHIASGDYGYVMMWKYDGISCSLVYQDGQLVSAATRGDGAMGSDLLEHVGMMGSVPNVLPDFYGGDFHLHGRVEIRGEIVCPKHHLREMSGYADCRSAASGLCNMKEPTALCGKLVFVPWEVYFTPDVGNHISLSTTPFAKQLSKMEFLHALGFERSHVWQLRNMAEIAKLIKEREEEREAYKYPTDGLVVRVADPSDFRALGFTDHHPKGSIAYKFAPPKTQTTVRRIEISIGATGRRTPVAWLEPVTISGRCISSASLGSEAKMREMGITEGCRVEVGLSNDVTPKIYRKL